MASSGKKVRLVELGPGRGTLMDDMLRVSQMFPHKIHHLGPPWVKEGPSKREEIGEEEEDRSEGYQSNDSDIIRIPNNIQ
jgi:hypothetical protein